MSAVWSCQLAFGAMKVGKNNYWTRYKLAVMVYLQPVSILLFSLVYFETTRRIVGLKGWELYLKDTKFGIFIFLIISFLVIFVKYCAEKQPHLFNIGIVFISLVILFTVFLLLFSLVKIRSFSEDINRGNRLIDTNGYHLQNTLQYKTWLAVLHTILALSQIPAVIV